MSGVEHSRVRGNVLQLRTAIERFLPPAGERAARVSAIEASLRSLAGSSMRQAMAEWIVDGIVPVTRLVPDAYAKWRPPVRDAITFVVSRLSPERLAPKLLEQIELPADTPAEKRLLCLIAKVPGLQKLGQVIARNQHLRPGLRRALSRLENGIRDVGIEEILAIAARELGPRLQEFEVRLEPKIMSEASVSAVVRFSWQNPTIRRRERAVFKVLKPHISEYFNEDMEYLQGLAEHFSDRHHRYGFPRNLIPDTFKKVSRLLRYEVNFTREQKTLLEAARLYRNVSGVRIPQVIQQLSTSKITALSEERGIKVTSAAKSVKSSKRKHIAEQVIEALVALPLLSSERDVIFHGDPHAGNLLYSTQTGELAIIDWALRERLSRQQRRLLALLFGLLLLKDGPGVLDKVLALTWPKVGERSRKGHLVSGVVHEYLDSLPTAHVPSMADVMRLLERVAMTGVKFPASLIMLSKVLFTLEGLVKDIAGKNTEMGLPIARQIAQHWWADRKAFRSPLVAKDWISLQCSALLYTPRLWMRWEKSILERLLPAQTREATTPA